MLRIRVTVTISSLLAHVTVELDKIANLRKELHGCSATDGVCRVRVSVQKAIALINREEKNTNIYIIFK